MLIPDAVACGSVASIDEAPRKPPDAPPKLRDLAESVEVEMVKILGIVRIAVEFWIFSGDLEADVMPDSTIAPNAKTTTIKMAAA